MAKKNGFLKNLFGGMLFGGNKVQLSVLEEEQMQSPFRTIVRSFFENKIALTGLIAFIIIFITCFTLAVLIPLDENFQDTTQQNVAPGLDLMDLPKELNGNVKEISVGSTFGVGVDNNGNAYTWGKLEPKLEEIIKKDPFTNYKLKSISAGLDHILAITEDGKAVTWAKNRFTLNTIPMGLDVAKNVKQVEAGFQFSTAVTEDGYLYLWGNTGFLGSLSQFTIPEDVQYNVEKVEVTTDNVFVLLKDGTIRVLGSETPSYKYAPELTNVIDIAVTDDMMSALTSDGQVHVWGNVRYDQEKLPENMPNNIIGITGGRSHFTAYGEDGMVYAWGRDNYKQASVPSSIESGKVKAVNVYSGYFQNYAVDSEGNVTTWGLKGYLMGSDAFGRDVFVRLLAGGRLTLTVGAVAVLIQVVLGIIIGGFAGFYGGRVDMLLMRFAEIVGSIPFLPLAMTLSVVVGNRLNATQRIVMIMVVLGVLSWSGLANLVRAQILSVKANEYVLAAKATGIRERVIIFRHIIPNVISVIVVNVTLSYAYSMMTESTLSFLGFGVLEPKPTWGNMLTGSQSSTTILNYWWRWVFPALSLALCTISINLIGDGLRDAIDPRSKDR